MQSENFILDQVRKEKEVKVKDLIKCLENFNPDADIILSERDGRDTKTHSIIRAYLWNERVYVDGHCPER